MEGHKIDIVREITYLRIKPECTGGWRRQKVRITAIGNHSQIAIDKCLTTMPNMRASMLYQIYRLKCESRILYGAEIWGTDRRVVNVRRKTGEIQKECAKNP
jgi:hypothetical protein